MQINNLVDRWLSMKHRRMDLVLMISVDDKNWLQKACNDILKRVIDVYLEKRWKTKVSEPPSKKLNLDRTEQEKDNISLVNDEFRPRIEQFRIFRP